MKNELRFFLVSALTFVLAWLTAVPAEADDYDIKVGGIYYSVTSASDLTCEVVKGDDAYSGVVDIPETVTYGVRTLTVTSISASAFRSCKEVTKVTIPNTVTEIYEYTFCGCKGLKSVTIGNSVASIGKKAFAGCSGLTDVTIGESVKSIGQYAFESCSSLTSVTIPRSVTSIGLGAFSECSKLTSVTIKENYNELQIEGTLKEKERIFYGCPLETVWVGRNLSYVGSNLNSAFYKMTALKKLTLGRSVTSIGNGEFGGCTSLTSLTIPENVTEIGCWAFEGCTSLKSLIIEDGRSSLKFYDYWAPKENPYVTKGSGWYDTQRGYFKDCPIESLYLGRKLAYYGIDNGVMSAPHFGSSLKEVTIGKYVTVIPKSAFSGSKSLPSVTIPNSVIEIGDYAFEDCVKLSSVTIPNSVTTIGLRAFYGCSSLTDVTIPNSVTAIYGSAFRGCASLTSVTIPNSVTMVCGGLFEDCTSLTSVTIPSSVTEIKSEAFNGCKALQNVISLATAPPTIEDEDAFLNTTYFLATLYVPDGTSSDYASAEHWKNFLIKEGTPSETAIKDITTDPQAESTIYDLQGHRLAQPRKGLNIINGKKVLVK